MAQRVPLNKAYLPSTVTLRKAMRLPANRRNKIKTTSPDTARAAATGPCASMSSSRTTTKRCRAKLTNSTLVQEELTWLMPAAICSRSDRSLRTASAPTRRRPRTSASRKYYKRWSSSAVRLSRSRRSSYHAKRSALRAPRAALAPAESST